MTDEFVVRLRGLPFSCSENDIRQFFDGIQHGVKRISFCLGPDDRRTGEAFAELSSEADFQVAMSKDRELVGKRYVEVFRSTQQEMNYVDRHNKMNSERREGPTGRPIKGVSGGGGYRSLLGGSMDNIVRLRGLPFGCYEEDIVAFFTGLNIFPSGIKIVTDGRGKQSGEAFVKFANYESYTAALEKDKQHIGHRYIDVFASSYEQMADSIGSEAFDLMESRSRFPYQDYYDEPFNGRRSMGMGIGIPSAISTSRTMSMAGYSAARYAPYASRRTTERGSNDISAYEQWRSAGNGATGLKGELSPSGGVGGKTGSDGMAVEQKHSVQMRGLPFKATQEEIVQFFSPICIKSLELKFDQTGRPSGEARVDFSTHDDAVESMKRDRNTMSGRYIELFLQSNAPMPAGYNISNGNNLTGADPPSSASQYQFSADNFSCSWPKF